MTKTPTDIARLMRAVIRFVLTAVSYTHLDVYKRQEKKSQMCEVECVRSDMGRGDELMLITRSN